MFLQHSKCLPTCRCTWLFPSTRRVLGRVFDAASSNYARAGPAGAPHHLQSCLAVAEHGGIHAHPSDVNTLAGVNATKPK